MTEIQLQRPKYQNTSDFVGQRVGNGRRILNYNMNLPPVATVPKVGTVSSLLRLTPNPFWSGCS